MASIPLMSSSDSHSDIVATLERDGCVVVTGALDEPTRKSLARELGPYIERADANADLDAKYRTESGAMANFYPGSTKRVTALAARSESFRSILTHPMTLAACEKILKPNCVSYQVHATSALVVGPGATEQVLHREDDGFPFFTVPRPNLVVASMWAISDFTAANGGTHLVPGSHRWVAGRRARDDEVAAAEMLAGSVLMWMGGTLHGAGANVSDGWRFGIFTSYSLGWLRQEENQYVDTPIALARSMPREVRDLLGYRMCGALGFYDPGTRP